MNDHHALYRFFGPGDVLLYVGITRTPDRRWEKHAHTKPWWTDVAKITVEPHESRESVLAAERQAIIAERPQYNVKHNGDRPPRAPVASQPIPEASPLGLRELDVVALGLTNRRCPVGAVTHISDRYITLALMSWVSGAFEDETVYRVDDIHEVLIARRKTDRELRAEGWTEDFIAKTKIYDMDPLGRMQTRWASGH